MGATNCPETPRQKMIQMMYLVYTAMLALNVSAEILNAFARWFTDNVRNTCWLVKKDADTPISDHSDYLN